MNQIGITSSLSTFQLDAISAMISHQLRTFKQKSALYSSNQCCSEPIQLSHDEVIIDNLLGEGCFNNVYGAKIILRSSNIKNKRGSSYAVKFSSPHVMDDFDSLKVAAVDLAMEGQILSCLKHENVITLHGIASGSFSEAILSNPKVGYFLVLDQLSSTLSSELENWQYKEETILKLAKMFKEGSKKSCQTTYLRRITVILEIAQALSYLHNNNILYRDLKPGNVGFDIDGVTKLFDFGLAKEIEPSRQARLHTKMTGSLRYMAPEVATGEKYSTSVDVYSFGILLW
eukprot:CAMPEP_0184868472 /NCGR_PEP_ID=MMETSP0580-20130426/30568_1 /TAXON_ID=1118495 /ORGANISM="Dactyliosolen fragilissimus" /LENGTH=286 /DNA_ID=CAMNT_0027369393 /DNA_START=173 /DNA_END=1030 /DNA_ORIENTATION=+